MAGSNEEEARGGSSDGRRRSVEEVKYEGVFFKMSRNSETALSLKAVITEKLHHIMGYSDEMLSDYIIVLICNGKNKNQTREKLEDFLQERSEEFVAWLWELLLEDFSSEREDGIAVNSSSSYADNSSKIDKSRNLKHNSAYSQGPFLVEKTCEPSETPSIDAPTKNVHFESKKFSRKVSSTELDNFKSSPYDHHRKISSAIVAADGEQIIVDSNKTRKPTEPQHQFLNFSDRQPDRWNPQSAPSGRVVSAGLADAICLQKAKPQVSVWDRLGKACPDVSVGVPNSLMPGICVPRKEMEVLHRHVASISVPNTDLSIEQLNDVPADGNRCSSFRSSLPRVDERAQTMDLDPRVPYNVNIKRHFNEISTCPDNSLVDNVNMGLCCKEPSHTSKKPNMIAQKSPTPKLVSDMMDVKQKLQRIEIQLSQLRRKQMERKKDGKPIFSSKSSGEMEHQKEDMDSRTVYVANVHFAATKEAISLYFSKCGVVEDVMILTGQANKPKGAAFVTFADKESANKALSLDGSIFFSRPVKVMPKAKAARVTRTTASGIRRADPAHVARKPALPRDSVTAFMGRRTFSSPHLQWCRGSSTAQSKPPAPTGTQEKKALPTTATQKQPSSSTTD